MRPSDGASTVQNTISKTLPTRSLFTPLDGARLTAIFLVGGVITLRYFAEFNEQLVRKIKNIKKKSSQFNKEVDEKKLLKFTKHWTNKCRD